MPSVFRILSIDGGGIRGVIPARILKHIEEETGHPCSSLFDMIAGTSTGGILATGLTKPKVSNPKEPEHSASAMLDFYFDKGPIIFGRPAWGPKWIYRAKHKSEFIETVLEETLNESMLSETLTDILVTAYEIENRIPFFFNSYRAKDMEEQEFFDFKLKDVARSTSAAPLYFKPHTISRNNLFVHKWNHDSKNYEKVSVDQYALIDGGVFANNPAMCAYVEMQKQLLLDNRTIDDWPKVIIISVGTGIDTAPIPLNSVNGSGFSWVDPRKNIPIMSSMFDGMAGAVHHQMRNLLNTYDEKDSDNIRHINDIPQGDLGMYIRLDPNLPDDQTSIDNSSKENIKDLDQTANNFIKSKAKELDGICSLLASCV